MDRNEFAGKKVMVVEDELTNFKLLEYFLKHYQFKIIHAWNGKEAVEIFNREKNVDLILMDIRLPFMDGIEATRAIRKMDPRVPVIAITAYTLDDDYSKCMAAGCNDFLSKPLVKEKLERAINEQLKIKIHG